MSIWYIFIDFFSTTTCFGLYRPSSGCITRGKCVLLILSTYSCIARFACRDLYINGFVLRTRWVFLVLSISSSARGVLGCTCVLLLSGLLGVGVVCCLCFGAGMSRSSALFPGWSSLWLLGCGWFAALSSLVGRCCFTVNCYHCAWIGCLSCISFLLQYLF